MHNYNLIINKMHLKLGSLVLSPEVWILDRIWQFDGFQSKMASCRWTSFLGAYGSVITKHKDGAFRRRPFATGRDTETRRIFRWATGLGEPGSTLEDPLEDPLKTRLSFVTSAGSARLLICSLHQALLCGLETVCFTSLR